MITKTIRPVKMKEVKFFDIVWKTHQDLTPDMLALMIIHLKAVLDIKVGNTDYLHHIEELKEKNKNVYFHKEIKK